MLLLCAFPFLGGRREKEGVGRRLRWGWGVGVGGWGGGGWQVGGLFWSLLCLYVFYPSLFSLLYRRESGFPCPRLARSADDSQQGYAHRRWTSFNAVLEQRCRGWRATACYASAMAESACLRPTGKETFHGSGKTRPFYQTTSPGDLKASALWKIATPTDLRV